uniref:BED-type domain-containing protein n=1 Tax=Sander lucioperca TaxID=283035 RepID=A0A8D0D640_SANLU
MDQGRNAFLSWKFKQHFTLKKEKGERNITVQCNLCLPATNLLSASKESTSNLKKHFKRKHSSVLQRAEMASDDGGERSAMPNAPPLKQATLSTSAITQRKVNSLVLEFIVADVQPFSLVENASFREMNAGISGGRTPMCRKTLMQRIERGSQNMKKALTETLQDVQTVCTTADIWTAHHRSFMGITCHWIEPETLDRKSAALACERIRGRHTYDVIAAKISQIHAEFQIQGKVSATVELRVSCIEKLMSLTESQLNGICDQLKVTKLHPQETMFLKEYTAILKPLAYSINLLQGEKNCYFGYIVPTILSLKAKLAEKLTQVQFSTHILSAVIKAIDTRFGQVLASHEARMAASTIPKFRLWWLADEERGAMKTAMVQETRLLHTEPSEDAGTTGNAAVGGDPQDDDNFFTFETAQQTSSSAEEEVQRYLQDPDKSLASLKTYPMIRALFLKCNTTLPSSAPVERLFSQGGLIFTPHRNKMTDKHFEQALLLRYNRLYWSIDM